ncbi:uncharacterized protein Dwil_GK13423 [Drosophila willistoni]|uniref:C2H2-type domain-containing protein n=1 Tax=Drosophila willistoni TaxID=7260 RepID=B4NJJ5_DROWI|nr:serendipity locus protein delta [Drosophila willistoni]EDW83919.1 uncharacterized protein Dwil_GK13423 [Drosophila willistoni]
MCHEGYLVDAKPIDSTLCSASNKSLAEALKYLINRGNSLYLNLEAPPAGGVLCLRCYNDMMDYDAALVGVLQKQLKLLKRFEENNPIIESDDSEIEVELQTEEENELERDFIELEVEIGREAKIRKHSHVLQLKKKFECELCEYAHRNEDYVKLHMNIHEGRSETTCLVCHKQFTTKMNTIRHMESHLQNKRHQCHKCGMCFSQSTVLYNHKLQHEAEENPLQCGICQSVFKTKRTYKHHLLTHRADRPRYACDFCEKTFTEKYTLKIHRRIHTVD